MKSDIQKKLIEESELNTKTLRYIRVMTLVKEFEKELKK